MLPLLNSLLLLYFWCFFFLPSLIIPYLFCFFSLHSRLTYPSSHQTLSPSLLEKCVPQGSYLFLFIRLLEGITGLCCFPSSHVYLWTLTIQLLHHLSCDALLLKVVFDPTFSLLCLQLPLCMWVGPGNFEFWQFLPWPLIFFSLWETYLA